MYSYLSRLITQWPEYSQLVNSILQEGATPAEVVEVLLHVIIQNLSEPAKSLQDMAGRARLCQQALSLIQKENDPETWSFLQVELGISLVYSLEDSRAQNIEDAIAAYRLALQVYSEKRFPEKWAMTIQNIAIAYRNRIEGDLAQNIEHAIALYTASLKIRTRQDFPEKWANTQANLASAYLNRIRGSRSQNLENAISACKLALEFYSKVKFPRDWARVQNSLAIAYAERVQGEPSKNIDAAILAHNRVLEVHTRERLPEEWAHTQNNLANAYSRKRTGNRAQNLEAAISAGNLALEIFDKNNFPMYWATAQNNLALVYLERMNGDRSENLEVALASLIQVLDVYTKEDFPDKWAGVLTNISAIFLERFQDDRTKNLEASISACILALEVYKKETLPERWAMTQTNIARAYSSLTSGNRAENFEKAITTYHRILEVYSLQDFPKEWAATQLRLGTAYVDTYNTSGDRAQNIEASIAAFNRALTVYSRLTNPEAWSTIQINLGGAYRKRIRGDHLQNIEIAISAYTAALEVLSREDFPRGCCKAWRLFGDLYSDESRWLEATQAYSKSLQSAEDVYQSATIKSSQISELKETDDLYRRASYAYAQIHDLQAAVTSLEQGRARGLRENLKQNSATLHALKTQAPILFDRYQTAATRMKALEIRVLELNINNGVQSNETLRGRVSEARAEVKTAIAEIRKMKGYKDFLALPTFIDITRGMQPQQTLVYIVTTASGGLALSITKSNDGSVTTEAINLKDFAEEKFEQLINYKDPERWFGSFHNFRENPKAYRRVWKDTIEDTTQVLWKKIMEPVTAFLVSRSINQATLIPCGLLNILPLHAAHTRKPTTPTGEKYALDYCCFTYAPSALALAQVQASLQDKKPHSLLAVNNPTQDLASSEHEIAMATAQFENHKTLSHQTATRESVLAAIADHSVIHFACHGSFYPGEPLNSRLIMAGDNDLKLFDFFTRSLEGVRLVILSACETGLPGIGVPDEVLNFSTGLLQAGVTGVISTLWPVADFSTALLLVRFYDFWNNSSQHPATALRHAQCWLRDSTTKEILEYLSPSLPGHGKIPKDTANWFYEKMKRGDREARPFQHPFHWAAFTYVGAHPPLFPTPSKQINVTPHPLTEWQPQTSSYSPESSKVNFRFSLETSLFSGNSWRL